jgi:hypothetical protein
LDALRSAARANNLPAGWENELDDRALLEWRKQQENAKRVQDTAGTQYKAKQSGLQKQLNALRRIQNQQRQQAAGSGGSSKDPYQERIWKYIEQLMRGV